MKKRLIAALVAATIFIGAVVFLLLYVQQSDARALAKYDPTDVVVAVAEIPAGTPAAELSDKVKITQMPAVAVPPGAVTAYDQLVDLVSAVDVKPGEQLMAHRWITTTAYEHREVEIPPGHTEVSLRLDVQQGGGGKFQPGDLASVFLTIDGQTRLALPHTLVTNVMSDPNAENNSKGVQLITLALTPEDASRVVLTATEGSLWLGRENPDTPNKVPAIENHVSVLR